MSATKKRQRSAERTTVSSYDKADEVKGILLKEGTFSSDAINRQMEEFLGYGLPSYYFSVMTPQDIAKHVMSLQAAKVLARESGRPLDIELQQESEKSAMFVAKSLVNTTDDHAVRLGRGTSSTETAVRRIERYIEDRYLSGGESQVEESRDWGGLSRDTSASMHNDIPALSLSKVPGGKPKATVPFRTQCYRTTDSIDDSGAHLRLYFLQQAEFVNAAPAAGETDINQLGDKTFLENSTAELRSYYQTVVSEASLRLGPSIRVFNPASDGAHPGQFMLLVGFKAGSTHSYFTGISDVYRYYDLFAIEKYVEPFANGVVVYAFHLGCIGDRGRAAGIIPDLVRDCSLNYVLPRTSLTPMLIRGLLSVHHVAYAYAVWKFAFHFLSRDSAELQHITAELLGSGKASKGIRALAKIRKSLQAHAFTEGAILETFFRNPEAITVLYQDFCSRHEPGCITPTKDEVEMQSFFKRSLTSEQDTQVFNSVYLFNRKVLKTNFFKNIKVALSFRMDPTFLSREEYPEIPFGLFFVIGSEFRGFHIRFRDVARGGIRVVKSPNLQAYATNLSSMFEENFNLAYTQQRKNKDIPEGGSKGVILLNLAHQDKTVVAFHKYVDSVLDVIMPTEDMIDRLGKEEILFFGPDENTADVMDWACQHAKTRGYRFWKAFTTGKSPSLGGIPHDKYGMTTHSVRQYALGIQEKLGLVGSSCTKVQTGGPDGDLGSNEILMGNEKTVAIVDGSGVLFDPKGINAEELKRLALGRKMVKFVDVSKISPEGKLVLVEDKDVVLPDGTVVESGMAFRNNFHLSHLSHGDFFIPCGGRPAAVTIDTVQSFVRLPNGSLRFKYIVEGANLFFTQPAREEIEKAGVIVFKDASANKGGVTSSSLEVLAALVLTDAEFSAHMAVPEDPDAETPEFYKEYVSEVQNIIDENARLEFDCLWREHIRTGIPRSTLTDSLSKKITDLSASIEDNETLWHNDTLRTAVLRSALPKCLSGLCGGFEAVVTRIPENYCRAIFGSRLASRFIYQSGLDTPEFAFFEFVSRTAW